MTEEEAWKLKDKELNSNNKADSNVEAVIEKMRSRSEVGLKKYGTTTERTDIDLVGWITHAQEEAMDLAIYLERIKNELENKNG